MTLYYRFMRMVGKRSPMTRTELTRRGLGMLQIKMPEFKKLIRKAERAKFIESVITYKDDRATTTFMITLAGKTWLEEQ